MKTQTISLQQSNSDQIANYHEHYDPSLLLPISRQEKREEIGLDNSRLPFSGVDIWTSFELSWLNARGKPQVGIATFRIPADSPNLNESKSFKLYLNSYNQTKMDNLEALVHQLTNDLSTAVGKQISVNITLPHQFYSATIVEPAGYCIDNLDIAVDNYTPCPQVLHADSDEIISELLCSNLLKSNCPATGQPDWGSLQIRYTGPRLNRASLLRYVIGFRQHKAFHEDCVERIFTDLLRICSPSQLTVYARYTRRGGLDINPFRSNCDETPARNTRTARQ